MKVGNLVKWIGFPGSKKNKSQISEDAKFGIIVRIWKVPNLWSKKRVDVSWGDGTFGTRLWSKTLEVIDENRRINPSLS